MVRVVTRVNIRGGWLYMCLWLCVCVLCLPGTTLSMVLVRHLCLHFFPTLALALFYCLSSSACRFVSVFSSPCVTVSFWCNLWRSDGEGKDWPPALIGWSLETKRLTLDTYAKLSKLASGCAIKADGIWRPAFLTWRLLQDHRYIVLAVVWSATVLVLTLVSIVVLSLGLAPFISSIWSRLLGEYLLSCI